MLLYTSLKLLVYVSIFIVMEKYFTILHTKTDHVLKYRKYKFCDVYLYIRKFLMFMWSS